MIKIDMERNIYGDWSGLGFFLTQSHLRSRVRYYDDTHGISVWD